MHCFYLILISIVTIANTLRILAYEPDKHNRERKEVLNTLPSWLPPSSSEFVDQFSCSGQDVALKSNSDGAFIQWVLSARHTTWTDGWEVPAANSSYARVFDLLNWSRLQNLLPRQIPVDSICHKGMEVMFGYSSDMQTARAPLKPNEYITDDTWSTLWTTCHKQLNTQSRISSSCIDIPAVVVANPYPPWKVNNPCHYEYRMIDGAHRLCLRKYLLGLLEGEILDFQSQLTALGTNTDSSARRSQIQSRIANLQKNIERNNVGSFFVLNQTTFQAMLTNSDPHTSWAKDEHILMKDFTTGLVDDWSKWMHRAMAHVRDEMHSDL